MNSSEGGWLGGAVLGLESPSYEGVDVDSEDVGLGCFFEGGCSGWKARATKGGVWAVIFCGLFRRLFFRHFAAD
jgi:hypothetical protein